MIAPAIPQQEPGTPTEAMLMRATSRAIARRVSLARRQRLGERIYDGTTLNPLGCTRCNLPFVSGEADKDEHCRLCVEETEPTDYGLLATANCLQHIYAAMRKP